MAYVSTMDNASGYMQPMGDLTLGSELTTSYGEASPFPHIVIDDFLPAEVLENVLRHCSDLQMNEDAVEFDRAQERFKRSYQPDSLPDDLRALFYSFNSRPFIKLIENITGIKGLIPDPYFFGAGIHEIRQGGHLSVHADFNHHKVMNLERRINVLIYLNKDWKHEYGGTLELWDQSMTTLAQDIVPVFNRCVIFNTTSNSQHGNPKPVDHPAGISRKSIALYYYTSPGMDRSDHTPPSFKCARNPATSATGASNWASSRTICYLRSWHACSTGFFDRIASTVRQIGSVIRIDERLQEFAVRFRHAQAVAVDRPAHL